MSERQQRIQNKIIAEIEQFRCERQTIQIAGLSAEGKPNVSYAPFVFSHHHYYIFISDIARHGQNLKQNHQVSIMLIEDEVSARTIFARKRLTLDGTAELVSRDSEGFSEILELMAERFGDLGRDLPDFSDFNLYRITPVAGMYVKGFGQAFRLSGVDLSDVHWLTEQPHTPTA